MQNGGCHPVDGCADGTAVRRAPDFQYLSRQRVAPSTGEPLLLPYAVHEVAGRQGRLHRHDPGGHPADRLRRRASPASTFGDEVETANTTPRELQAQGVEAIVVLLHEGGAQTGANAWDINGCNGLTGPIVDIANADRPRHRRRGQRPHPPGVQLRDRRQAVTSASSFGRLVTDIDLQIDRRTGDVVTATADNVVVDPGRCARTRRRPS